MGGSAGLENLHAPLDRTLFGKTEDVVQISWAPLKWRTVGHTPGCVCALPGGARWRTRLLDATETRDGPVAGGTGWLGPDTCWLGRCQNEFTSK